MVLLKQLIVEGNNTCFNGIKKLCFMSLTEKCSCCFVIVETPCCVLLVLVFFCFFFVFVFFYKVKHRLLLIKIFSLKREKKTPSVAQSA